MLWCPECEDWILRSRRHSHPHDLEEQRDVTEEKEDLNEDCNVFTKTYEVEFVYEYREVVQVEATDKGEAKWKAEEDATYRGEYIDTLHSTSREIGDESVASIEYLETHGLLPEDHDVTPADLKRLGDSDA